MHANGTTESTRDIEAFLLARAIEDFLYTMTGLMASVRGDAPEKAMRSVQTGMRRGESRWQKPY